MTDSEIADLGCIRILGDVTSHLARGGGSEESLVGVAGALCRGLRSEACWIWIRTADGTAYRPVCAEGGTTPPDGYAQMVKEWVGQPSFDEQSLLPIRHSTSKTRDLAEICKKSERKWSKVCPPALFGLSRLAVNVK